VKLFWLAINADVDSLKHDDLSTDWPSRKLGQKSPPLSEAHKKVGDH
jgi:hypothetical protein